MLLTSRRALIARGAKMQLLRAAGRGDLDAIEYQIEEALVYACIRGQNEVALHEAANRGTRRS